jgi:hypothetical protein
MIMSRMQNSHSTGGWPARSLVRHDAWFSDCPAPNVSDRRALMASGGVTTSLGPYTVASNAFLDDLLYRALHSVPWPVAINTVFYAAILWVLFAALGIRRWRRIRRGQCPACAYPVGSSDVCTECGAELKQKAESTA